MWGEPRNEVKTRKRGEMMKWDEGEGVARKDLKGGKAAGERGGERSLAPRRGGRRREGVSVSVAPMACSRQEEVSGPPQLTPERDCGRRGPRMHCHLVPLADASLSKQ